MWKHFTYLFPLIVGVLGCDTKAPSDPTVRPTEVIAQLVGTWVILHRELPDGEADVQYRVEFKPLDYGEGISGELVPQITPGEPASQRLPATRSTRILDGSDDDGLLVSYEINWWPSQRDRAPNVMKATGRIASQEIVWERVGGSSWAWDISRLGDGIITMRQDYAYDVELKIIWRKETANKSRLDNPLPRPESEIEPR